MSTRQPSSPEHRPSQVNEEITQAAMSAKLTLMGRQIDHIIDNSRTTHQAVVDLSKIMLDGFAAIHKEFEEQRKSRAEEGAKTRTSNRLWSTLGTGAVVTLLRLSWDRLVDAWHALFR